MVYNKIINNLESSMKGANLFLIFCIVAQIQLMLCFCVVVASADDLIHSAPSENVTVPLDQTTLVNFSCSADGIFVKWVINEQFVRDKDNYDGGVTFYPDVSISSGHNISMGINVTTARNNNTKIYCAAVSDKGTFENSTTVTLTIAGPPLAPHPKFHVVNATHIEVQWDKPFALPEFDVQNYTLLIANTSSENDSTINRLFHISADTAYPIRHYINNGGDIPKECVYLQFILTATNDAGTSDASSVAGGFPIAPSRIPDDPDSLQYMVIFTQDFIPTLHINFTFPEVCDYHDANYSVLIFHGNGSLVYKSTEKTYDKDSPENVEVVVSQNLQKDSSYTAEINVSTAVKWTTTQFQFDTNTNTNNTLEEPDVDDLTAAGSLNTAIIITSSVAAGLFAILLVLINVVMIAFIMRRRKLKQRNRAHQRELETDEAVQRATEAMVPNPLYSGYPIYEEIIDSAYAMNSWRNVVPETTSKDEGYVAISADAVKYVSTFPLPEDSKMVQDKYTTFPEDNYTVMNPAGTLSNQSKGPPYEVPFMHHSLHNGSGVFQEPYPLTETTEAMTNGGHCAAAAGSAPATTSFMTQDEERYVKGAF